jgi:hypothetical protein
MKAYRRVTFGAWIVWSVIQQLVIAGCGTFTPPHPPPPVILPTGTAIDVGSEAVAASNRAKPRAWPDGTMGIERTSTGYRFYAAGPGAPISCDGTLETPISAGCRVAKPIQGLKAALNYAAGGPIYRDPTSGTMLMVYHGERWKDPVSGEPFHSSLGLAKSTDGGVTWTDLGEIITPNVIPAALFTRNMTHDVGGGAYLIIGGYFYVYFRDWTMTGDKAEIAVARARVADVVDASVNHNTVVPWTKYYNRGWTEPGLGGRSSPLETPDTLAAWWDVSYNSYLGRYIMVAFGAPWPATDLYWLDSVDGLSWDNRKLIVDDSSQKIYVTLAGLGADSKVTGQRFYVYYISSAKGGAGDGTANRTSDDFLARRLITLSTAVSSEVTTPTISITSPANGATVCGIITVSVSASDDARVAGLQSKLDGAYAPHNCP